MKVCLVVALLMTVLVCSFGCTHSSSCTREGTPAAVADGAVGDPCRTSTECAAGLLCEPVFGGGSELAGATCTLDCTNATCPTGTACVDTGSQITRAGGVVDQIICLPACTSDADCQHGARAGRCRSDTDAGPGARTCAPLSCYAPQQGGAYGCPSGYACKEYPVGCGDDRGGAPTGGWCQRQP